MTQAPRDRFVAGVLHGEDRSPGAFLLRGLLTPLAWLHQAGLEAYLLPFRTGIRKRYRLPVPVIAIGNLASGGTGKTPMAHLVAGHLHAAGRRVVLLSRGHGGSGESGRAPRVVSDGERVLLTPNEAGDEPVLLARLLPGVPVIVGRDRRSSGRLAMARFRPEVIVLDDALQYWQLHRDLDIVLLDARRPFDNGSVLPRGLLREPPSHLARAGVVVLTRADRVAPQDLARHVTEAGRLAPHAAVFTAAHAPAGWVHDAAAAAGDRAAAALSSAAASLLPPDALKDDEAFAFCGIADGDAFVRSVRALGVHVGAARILGDHHVYTAQEVEELAHTARGTAAVTTEKDLVKVAPFWPAAAPPLYALRVGMRLNEEDAFFVRIDAVARSGNGIREEATP